MSELKRCTRCVLPETHETIIFDGKGVCNVCAGQEIKQSTDWNAAKKELDEIIVEHKGKYDYDCIIPFSGGKDSTWTLYYLMKEYGLKPLVVRFDHGFLRSKLQENTKRTMRKLGADFHHFTPNWKVVQKLMLQSFLEKGDFCWHCHSGIFSYPMWVALRYNVPLIIWGEPSAEYTAYFSYEQKEEVDEKRFNRFVNLGITASDMYVKLGGTVDMRDLKPYDYPPLKELRKLNYRSICLGSYIPWDVTKQSQIIKEELGWEGDEVENVPSEYSYEKVECYMQGVRDFIKYIKRGYTRPSHLASIDIRNHRMTRPEALKMVKLYEGKKPPSLELFLEFTGLTESEFFEIAKSHTVSPWNLDVDLPEGKKTWDFDRWERQGEMDRKITDSMLERWRKLNNSPKERV